MSDGSTPSTQRLAAATGARPGAGPGVRPTHTQGGRAGRPALASSSASQVKPCGKQPGASQMRCAQPRRKAPVAQTVRPLSGRGRAEAREGNSAAALAGGPRDEALAQCWHLPRVPARAALSNSASRAHGSGPERYALKRD